NLWKEIMSFRNTYDLEFRERAVRMYLDRLKEDGVSKRAARLEVGELLGVNESTLRNWVRVQVGEGATAAAGESVDEENARLRKENAQTSILDRKSTRLNSSHVSISYAVFCLKKKKKIKRRISIKCHIHYNLTNRTV